MAESVDPYDPMCERFARDMAELDMWTERKPRVPKKLARIAYIVEEEGTYNPENGHFLCDDCYINAGQPSSINGWRCP